jgi:hypothetical protein
MLRHTKALLWRWGRWAGGGIPGSFPKMSAFMRLQMGTSSCREASGADPEILECDRVIAAAARPIRKLIVRHYCGDGTSAEKAARMGVSRRKYFELLDDARWFVNSALDNLHSDGHIRASVRVQTLG